MYPCNAVAERHQFACYVQLVNVLGPRSGWDWTTVSHQCAAIHPSRFVAACFDSMGLWAFARASGQARGIERICAAGGTAGQSACVAGAARTAINQNPTSVASQRRAGALCASYATHDLALARHCYASAGVVLRTLGGDALRSGCAVVGGSRFASACMQALPDMRQLPAQGGLS